MKSRLPNFTKVTSKTTCKYYNNWLISTWILSGKYNNSILNILMKYWSSVVLHNHYFKKFKFDMLKLTYHWVLINSASNVLSFFLMSNSSFQKNRKKRYSLVSSVRRGNMLFYLKWRLDTLVISLKPLNTIRHLSIGFVWKYKKIRI